MNPSDAHSPLATLRQLKEMLDAGTLTPQEFEALKQQLVFGGSAATGAAVPADALGSTPAPLPPTEPLPFLVTKEPIAGASPASEVSSVADSPDWLAAPAPPLITTHEPAAYAEEEEERRNPLTLVLPLVAVCYCSSSSFT